MGEIVTEAKNKKKRANLTATMENYLELIYKLQRKYGAVRVTDIAKKAGCKLPSVTNALQRLAKKGYIKYENYRPVVLTEKGKAAVDKLEFGQVIIARFLHNVLGMEKKEAQKEACFLEHIFSRRVLKHLHTLLKFINTSIEGQNFCNKFCEYIKNSYKKIKDK